jgi:hypothetical protein
MGFYPPVRIKKAMRKGFCFVTFWQNRAAKLKIN